eukprot:763578-Hanusia_phi.AAC.1
MSILGSPGYVGRPLLSRTGTFELIIEGSMERGYSQVVRGAAGDWVGRVGVGDRRGWTVGLESSGPEAGRAMPRGDLRVAKSEKNGREEKRREKNGREEKRREEKGREEKGREEKGREEKRREEKRREEKGREEKRREETRREEKRREEKGRDEKRREGKRREEKGREGKRREEREEW